MIKTIAFDADDTLWHMESLFNVTQEKFSKLLAGYQCEEQIEKKLFQTEMRNLRYFGYGVKGFTLSMIETAIELSRGRIQGYQVQKIIEYARQMLESPVELLAYTEDTIKALAPSYLLMLITKGDLFDQESKIARSGLSRYFKHIEIRTSKTAQIYQDILEKYSIKPGEFLMVGNSLKSDIFPVLEMGGYAAYIPYPICWEHEKAAEAPDGQENYTELENLGQLPQLVSRINAG